VLRGIVISKYLASVRNLVPFHECRDFYTSTGFACFQKKALLTEGERRIEHYLLSHIEYFSLSRSAFQCTTETVFRFLQGGGPRKMSCINGHVLY
jgi:hypothetical protein